LEEADVQEVFSASELTDEGLEQLAALSDTEDEEDAYAIVERLQLTTSSLKKGLQMVDEIVYHFLRSTVSWISAYNISRIWRLSWHHTRRC
jgi:hypothetical protein